MPHRAHHILSSIFSFVPFPVLFKPLWVFVGSWWLTTADFSSPAKEISFCEAHFVALLSRRCSRWAFDVVFQPVALNSIDRPWPFAGLLLETCLLRVDCENRELRLNQCTWTEQTKKNKENENVMEAIYSIHQHLKGPHHRIHRKMFNFVDDGDAEIRAEQLDASAFFGKTPIDCFRIIFQFLSLSAIFIDRWQRYFMSSNIECLERENEWMNKRS